jgi:hypothetical protein
MIYEKTNLNSDGQQFHQYQKNKHHRGRDHMVVGFITTYEISAYHHQRCEFESCTDEACLIQHYVI